jgi:hypothetical protein
LEPTWYGASPAGTSGGSAGARGAAVSGSFVATGGLVGATVGPSGRLVGTAVGAATLTGGSVGRFAPGVGASSSSTGAVAGGAGDRPVTMSVTGWSSRFWSARSSSPKAAAEAKRWRGSFWPSSPQNVDDPVGRRTFDVGHLPAAPATAGRRRGLASSANGGRPASRQYSVACRASRRRRPPSAWPPTWGGEYDGVMVAVDGLVAQGDRGDAEVGEAGSP